MRKISLVGLLLVVGCVPAGECDEMSRNWEQVIQAWANGSSGVAFNRNGSQVIALGSQDTSGGVIITPRSQQGSAVRPILITPNSPYVGFLQGPVDIAPVAAEAITFDQLGDPTQALDIGFYECEPAQKVERGAYFYDGTPAANTPSTGAARDLIYFRVRGRKRISVIASINSADTITVRGVRIRNGTAITVDSQAASGTIIINEFVTTYNEATTGTVGHGYSVFDYVSIEKASGKTWTSVSVQAWDY